MSKRFYIHDFVEDLNYRAVILYVGEHIDLDRLRKKLEKDYCNHLYRFDYMLNKEADDMRRFFYIENCDFQDLDFPIHEYVGEDGYNIYNLQFDSERYFIEVDL